MWERSTERRHFSFSVWNQSVFAYAARKYNNKCIWNGHGGNLDRCTNRAAIYLTLLFVRIVCMNLSFLYSRAKFSLLQYRDTFSFGSCVFYQRTPNYLPITRRFALLSETHEDNCWVFELFYNFIEIGKFRANAVKSYYLVISVCSTKHCTTSKQGHVIGDGRRWRTLCW